VVRDLLVVCCSVMLCVLQCVSVQCSVVRYVWVWLFVWECVAYNFLKVDAV